MDGDRAFFGWAAVRQNRPTRLWLVELPGKRLAVDAAAAG